MPFVKCKHCGNVGWFEIVDAIYTPERAVEYLVCMKCGRIKVVELDDC